MNGQDEGKRTIACGLLFCSPVTFLGKDSQERFLADEFEVAGPASRCDYGKCADRIIDAVFERSIVDRQ